ncbi:MAG: hypothetical protein R3A48_21305 [Polyangiales bacterium]
MSTLSSRRWNALVYVLGAVFFTALGLGVLRASMRMHPGLASLLKGFIGLMFGSLSLGALLAAARALRPLRPPPAELLARCLCCGERTPADAACPACGYGVHPRAELIAARPPEWPESLLFAGGACALICLGLFVAVGPWIDGERRLWVLVAMGALALLLLLVGGAGALGSAMSLLAALRTGAKVSTSGELGGRSLSGDGFTRGDRLVRFDGFGVQRAPLPSRAALATSYRQGVDTRLAETLATFEAAGLLELSEERTWRWSLEPDDDAWSLKRTAERRLWVDLLEGDGWQEGGLAEAVGNFLQGFMGEAVTLSELRELLAERTPRRAQCDAHAEALRERGVRVLPERVAAAQAALDDDAAEARG